MNADTLAKFHAMRKAADAYLDGLITGDELAAFVVDYTDAVWLEDQRWPGDDCRICGGNYTTWATGHAPDCTYLTDAPEGG